MPSQIKQDLSQQTEELVMWISVVRRSALVLFDLLLPGYLVAQQYHRTDLTVDMQAVSPSAPNVDSNLVNAWGLSRGSGSPCRISTKDCRSHARVPRHSQDLNPRWVRMEKPPAYQRSGRCDGTAVPPGNRATEGRKVREQIDEPQKST